ncbi:MAG: ActD-like protein, partial [Nannocystaceae bacterium]|nr:ActD-like protein [Nannocystaceae bacterium]
MPAPRPMRPKRPTLAAFTRFAACLLAVQGCTGHDRDAHEQSDAGGLHADHADDPVRVKGLRPHLVIHRKRGTKILRLGTNAVARSGDVVQVSYVAAGNRHGVILSLDDRGVVTLHHPNDTNAAPLLRARGERPLSHGYALDDAVGFERFVFVTSGDTALDVVQVLDAARAVAVGPASDETLLRLPSGWRQTSVTLAKESPAKESPAKESPAKESP